MLGLRYLLSGRNPQYRNALKRSLKLTSKQAPIRVLSNLFSDGDATPAPPPYAPLTIIMPIYNAFELLPESLERLVANTDLPWHLILLEDCSSDTRVRPWLRDWVALQGSCVTLLENDHNLGFVGSVNRGLRVAVQREEHVVLLNSDAFLPKDWASRLLSPILMDTRVASVTPMSNDATIFSIPSIANTVQISPGAVDIIDAAAEKLSGVSEVDVPTGVGFCMAMNRDALKKLPEFDAAFGRGYGEEVDWCQKLLKYGMRHVGISNLFVEHRGGSSFGSEVKLAAMEKAGQIIRTRYPNFDSDVQAFIRTDPLFTPRLYLSIAYAAAHQGTPLDVYIAHSLGGGAEHWLKAQIRASAVDGRTSVVICVGGNGRFNVELHMHDDMQSGETDDMTVVTEMLRGAPRRNVIYSCGWVTWPRLNCRIFFASWPRGKN